MKSRTNIALLLAAACCASGCGQPQNKNGESISTEIRWTEKPFVSGGRIEMQLAGGEYDIRPAAGTTIRIGLGGNIGGAKAELAATGASADLRITDTPHSNFTGTIEVPSASDLVVRLSAGNLTIGAITGNKDVESTAGNLTIVVGDSSEYSSVDASVKAGDIDAAAFGGSKSGLFQNFKWSGQGKHTLRAQLGAGNLELKGK
jgi:hypothetical protein